MADTTTSTATPAKPATPPFDQKRSFLEASPDALMLMPGRLLGHPGRIPGRTARYKTKAAPVPYVFVQQVPVDNAC